MPQPPKYVPPPRQRFECGICIYCGNRGTQDEHVVPMWAGGVLELVNGSCDRCATIINKEIESPMSRGPFWSARLYMGLKSRRKHREPLPVWLKDNQGGERMVRVTEQDNPAMLNLPSIAGPYIFDGEDRSLPDGVVHTAIHMHHFDNAARDRFFAQYPGEHPTLGWIQMVPLARLLAKIAHGFAVIQHGQEAFVPLLRDFILHGKTIEDAHYFVGTRAGVLRTDNLHEIECNWVDIRGIEHLVYDVCLFAFGQMPIYRVVVGTRPAWTTYEEVDAVWGIGN